MKKILLVDDDQEIRVLISHLLVEYPFQISALSDPEDALRFLSAPGVSFDILLTDYYMPKMSGVRLLSEAHKRGVLPPKIILFTAADSLEPEISSLLKEIPHIKIIMKPSVQEELTNIFNAFISEEKHN